VARAEGSQLTGDRFYRRLAELESTGEPFVLATVVRAQGSVPRHEGTKMLVFPGGRSEGTVGGGDLEHRVIQAALEALRDGQPRKLSYSFRDLERGDVGDRHLDDEHTKVTTGLFSLNGAGHAGKGLIREGVGPVLEEEALGLLVHPELGDDRPGAVGVDGGSDVRLDPARRGYESQEC